MKKHLSSLFLLLIVFSLSIFAVEPPTLEAADVTATWSGFGDWSDPTRWSTDPDIPNNIVGTSYDVEISSGTVSSDVAGVTVDGLALSGTGLIRGSQIITVVTSGSWTNGRVFETAGINVDTGATFLIAPGGIIRKELEDQSSLTVNGLLSMTDSLFSSDGVLSSDVVIDIAASGTLDLQSDASLLGGASNRRQEGTLTNAGILRKSAGSGVSTIDGHWDVVNTGSLIVESGTLRFNNFSFGNTFQNNGMATAQAGTLEIGNGTSTGTFDVQAGAAMRTTSTVSGQHVFDGAQIANAGTLTLDGNTQFTNAATYTGAGSVAIASGNLTGDVALTFPDLSWTGGTIRSTAGIVVPSAGVATVSGSSAKRFGDANLLTIEGTANVTSSNSIQTDASAAQPATINIAATGTLDFQGDTGLAASVNIDPRGGVLTVDGTLRKSAGTLTSTITSEWTVTNNSVVDVQTGTVAFEGAVSGSGSYTGTGIVAFDGEFSPGDSPAEIDFDGDVEFGSGATLSIEIGGTTPGTDFDLLDIDCTGTLDGELDVTLIDSFEPILGDTFEIINAATLLTGTFSTTSLPTLLDSELGWDLVYEDNALTLEIVSLGIGGSGADFDGDTAIDGTDLSIWGTNYGTAGISNTSTGDADLDGDTDGFDFLTWQREYTGPAPSLTASFATVPEPSTVLLTFATMVCWSLRAGRR